MLNAIELGLSSKQLFSHNINQNQHTVSPGLGKNPWHLSHLGFLSPILESTMTIPDLVIIHKIYGVLQ